MAKIDENVFEEVSSKAHLKDNSIQDISSQDIQRYVMVYDVPKLWIDALKKNKLKSSQYFKQAVLEKLQRDNMI